MKKFCAVILIFALTFSFVSCGSSQYDNAEKIFSNLKAAYEQVDDFSEDIMKAWELGINDIDSLKGKTSKYSYYSYYSSTTYDYVKGLQYFAEQIGVTEAEISKGVAYAVYGEKYADYIDANSISEIAEAYEDIFSKYSNNFSACIDIVISTYEANGKLSPIEASITVCRGEMKALIEDNPDCEYISDLKDYYVNMMSFYDYCKNPTGTYETALETVNTYRVNERTYYFALQCFLDDTTEDTTTSVENV